MSTSHPDYIKYHSKAIYVVSLISSASKPGSTIKSWGFFWKPSGAGNALFLYAGFHGTKQVNPTTLKYGDKKTVIDDELIDNKYSSEWSVENAVLIEDDVSNARALFTSAKDYQEEKDSTEGYNAREWLERGLEKLGSSMTASHLEAEIGGVPGYTP